MNVQKKNLKFSSVYFIRFLRRHNEKKINAIADKCLMCDKCHALCPVGVDAPALRRAQRATVNNLLPYNYAYLGSVDAGAAAELRPYSAAAEQGLTRPGSDGCLEENGDNPIPEVLYFAGCMTHLTPRIIKSVEKVFKAAGVEYAFADRDGGICCGRPLMLAGKADAAAATIAANKKMIQDSGCKTLVLSCPICYKIFKEEYHLEGIKVFHYTQFINELIASGRLKPGKTSQKIVYHDPCELGRGCGVYLEPRAALGQVGTLVKAAKEYDESVCCGGSLGSLTLDSHDRGRISEASLDNLLVGGPDTIVTACPLCLKTFSEAVLKAKHITRPVEVKDFAEVICQ